MQATVNGPNIIIPPIALPGGNRSVEHAVDLSAHQGRIIHVYVSAAGEVEINPRHDTYWQIAEVALPPAQSEQVATGTREEIAAHVATIQRGEGLIDAVSLDANQWVGDVGFSWALYRADIDYTIDPGGVVWIDGGRRPAAGSDYLVEIVTATTVPVTESRTLPLDLAQHTVTFFDLPQ